MISFQNLFCFHSPCPLYFGENCVHKVVLHSKHTAYLRHQYDFICSDTCCSGWFQRHCLFLERLASLVPFWNFASVSLVGSGPSLLVECDHACCAKLLLSGVYYQFSAFTCRRRWKSRPALSSWRRTKEAASDGQPACLVYVRSVLVCSCLTAMACIASSDQLAWII
jgi:hypothetical protein